MPYSDTGTSAYERGTSREPFLLAQAPAGAPVATAAASPTVAPLPPLPPGELSLLTANEKADNDRFDRVHNQLARKNVDCFRSSWHWPESFFKSEGPGRPRLATAGGELLCTYYAGQTSAILGDFYENQHFFESWDDSQIDKANFVFRRGDILLFKGHSMIVAGDNVYDDLVISQISWNRTKQQCDARGLDFSTKFPGSPDYGVTRNRLKDLQDPNLCPADMQAIFRGPFRIYRLKRYLDNYTALEVFDQASELAPDGKPFTPHPIKLGETLAEIAKQHHVTVDSLVKANGIKNSDLIYPGDVLIIP